MLGDGRIDAAAWVGGASTQSEMLRGRKTGEIVWKVDGGAFLFGECGHSQTILLGSSDAC